MWKKIGKFLLAITTIGASAAAIYAWYKNTKKDSSTDDEFSDIFEDDDVDLDENL